LRLHFQSNMLCLLYLGQEEEKEKAAEEEDVKCGKVLKGPQCEGLNHHRDMARWDVEDEELIDEELHVDW
jgi:hypothetical protein